MADAKNIGADSEVPPKRHSVSRRAYLILGSAIFAIILLNTFVFVRYWEGDRYSGRIVEVSQDRLIIRDQAGTRLTVILSEATEIREARKIVSREALAPGNFIWVFGVQSPEGIEAYRIGIFDRSP